MGTPVRRDPIPKTEKEVNDEIQLQAIAIRDAESKDVRHRIGPPIEQPFSYWVSLVKAVLWMKATGIQHLTERKRI